MIHDVCYLFPLFLFKNFEKSAGVILAIRPPLRSVVQIVSMINSLHRSACKLYLYYNKFHLIKQEQEKALIEEVFAMHAPFFL